MRIYAVRDTLAEETGPIFEAKNDAVASRKFKMLVDGSKVNIAELRLYVFGEIDHETDSLMAYPVPKIVDMFVPIELVKEEAK